ncbi:methylenetetrahydrofolate--tRNA-(uracil(54)-C(5))-methyltransferase (FADH(2)-oxidizing) TrmFO [Desulfovibrio litoralis]|uniref:Methylenetetrahydrofolate--tRNA-(uracil-5-)-methyltransferase TrmFO n=1 Tax=Desulfovibrio litoralis DSM 11393 TaxID=1121455 RepID=A0A1M7T1N6_9BACT|nr:methylenetetrahydrofolate--tRNA-(uracil(54)-C(5))-methyltransferase (FADH(2)-oxidizing) TrmFO [Desulfovibrio litoralis]SHN64557.1 methylenetetrahydrofolate--tRNA-(uracil-5-)-methyltransferase [Desulfovibrio litoralis DSM 11393]
MPINSNEIPVLLDLPPSLQAFINQAKVFYNKLASDSPQNVAVIGGGLAGSEVAFSLALSGHKVSLFEMKPNKYSPAHTSSDFAELVCSNSFRSADHTNAIGLLKLELKELNSLTMAVAEETKVPAGKALAVDRELFSKYITAILEQTPNLTIIREEVCHLDLNLAPLKGFDKVVLSTGPLSSEPITEALAKLTGQDSLYFYDAIAPIISAESVDRSIVFAGSRYNPEEEDYLNCPFTKEEYEVFYQALINGETVGAKDFEKEIHFEGCMPIEALAARGEKTLLFGTMKPVGFEDPRTGRRPFALLQLRPENRNKETYNLVGFQTKLLYKEQERIFRLVPGLANAEFIRHGSMHRNTYVNAPKTLNADLSLKANPKIHLAGQITGVEGYLESAANGLWLGFYLANNLSGKNLSPLPETSVLGSLMNHLQRETKNFQPSNVQYGLMPELHIKAKKKSRKELYAQRTREAFEEWLSTLPQ